MLCRWTFTLTWLEVALFLKCIAMKGNSRFKTPSEVCALATNQKCQCCPHIYMPGTRFDKKNKCIHTHTRMHKHSLWTFETWDSSDACFAPVLFCIPLQSRATIAFDSHIHIHSHTAALKCIWLDGRKWKRNVSCGANAEKNIHPENQHVELSNKLQRNTAGMHPL